MKFIRKDLSLMKGGPGSLDTIVILLPLMKVCYTLYNKLLMICKGEFKRILVNLYFDGPELSLTIQKLDLSVTWHDQGWGNPKGELWLNLMRRPKDGGGEPPQIASYRPLFGIAEHFTKSSKTAIQHHPVVTNAGPGDFYRFMRHVGGGGGHSLKVWNFRVVAILYRL